MELLWLQPMLLALMPTNTNVEPSKPVVADIEGREVCSSLELLGKLAIQG